MCRYLWKTAGSQINFPFILIFCLRCCNFLPNITVRLVLGLYVQNNIIQNNFRPKPNYKIAYYSLKNMSLGGIGARGDTKRQNFNSFFEKS